MVVRREYTTAGFYSECRIENKELRMKKERDENIVPKHVAMSGDSAELLIESDNPIVGIDPQIAHPARVGPYHDSANGTLWPPARSRGI